jgi:hypothetical protein
MRKMTAICDLCGFKKTYDVDKYEPDILKGWGYVHINGPYKNVEACPECLKSLLGVDELQEDEKEDD